MMVQMVMMRGCMHMFDVYLGGTWTLALVTRRLDEKPRPGVLDGGKQSWDE